MCCAKEISENTVILVTEDVKEEALNMGINPQNVVGVKPYEEYEYENIIINTIPAYNKYKEFHPKSKNWVGYIIEMDGVTYYIAGDTDETKEARSVECDVAFLPVRRDLYYGLFRSSFSCC